MRNHPAFLKAIRIAVVEYGLPVKEIAALAGLRESTISRHVTQEGLTLKTVPAPEAVRRRMARLARDVLPKMEAAARKLTNEKGDWNKSRLDVVTQLSRLMDRFGELAVQDQQQQEESAKDRDEQTAEALRRVDERIIELAQALARRMGEEQYGQSGPALDRP